MTRHETVSLDDLLQRHTPDMSLEQPFYTDRSIFERDLERVVAPQWLFVEHISALPEPGDYVLFEVAGESIIIVRGRDREVRALFNVCRHRGSRICLEPKGNVRTLTCPYHAWVYDLGGALLRAPLMADDFDAGDWSLHACHVHVWEGMIFINLAGEGEEVADFNEIAEAFERYTLPYRLGDAKVVHRETYPTDANWKLAVENFRECYHCAAAHPEYTLVNAYVNDGAREPAKRAKLVAD
ncbi:MAG: aromatic ring-hydroxylating dioxygenase subunit alpha, partial [Rhodospirillaceae bacterium]|nr:aromatic ring-hydroxylating dioxygenase subunit alpha [Rhodospirillaceae bacterium]